MSTSVPGDLNVSSEWSVPVDLNLNSPLWQFAGRFWQRTEAQEAALLLQDRGWSVTDILCALWLAWQGRTFSPAGVGEAIAWRRQVTEILRNLRKAIGKHNPGTDKARNCIAQSELEAERVELALAYRALEEDNLIQNAPQEHTAIALALGNLQAAAPEHAMNNETGKLLEILAIEFQAFTVGERQPCL